MKTAHTKLPSGSDFCKLALVKVWQFAKYFKLPIRKYKNIVICVLASFTIFSCNKEINIPESDENNYLKSRENLEYYVENGILNIKDKKVFENLIVENSKKTKKELEEWQDSVGFKCFQTFYQSIFNEYEAIIEGENPIENLKKYEYSYKDYIEFPGGMIDDLPDYSINPRLNMIYATVANVNGLVKIKGKIIDAKNFVKLKSSSHCYKKTSSRRMWMDVTTTHISTGNILDVQVSQQKKVVFAWVSYQTQYFWELETPPLGYYYSINDVPTGTVIYMPWPNGTNYLKMWNRGVGESNACTFTIPIW